MGKSLDRVDAGERVLFSRRGRVYAITPVYDEDCISPELALKIEQARKEFLEGKGVSCKTPKEIENYIHSL